MAHRPPNTPSLYRAGRRIGLAVLLSIIPIPAGATPAPCDTTILTPPPPSQSVAWLSPIGRRASRGRWLPIIPTAAIRGWLATHPEATRGQLLRHLGLRKRAREPKKRWKITIFEVDSSALCRPLEGADSDAWIRGVQACPGGLGNANRMHDGCGVTRDYTTDGTGPEWFRARWRNLAARGFCVLPLPRYLEEVHR